MEPKKLDILMIFKGEAFLKEFNNLSKKVKEKYPYINLYHIEPSPNYKEEIDKLKDIKFDILSSLPLFNDIWTYILEKFPSIKWIHSLAAGIERIFKIENLMKNDEIIISNSRGAYSESLGEIGITAMMYFSYQIFNYVDGMQKKKWFTQFNHSLEGKTLLIIGYGNNGICLAKKAKLAFNMKIIAVKKDLSSNFKGKEYTDEAYTLDNLPDKKIFESDYIYATLPETKETINIFDKNFFAKMNKDAVFINIGRGKSVVEDDIIEALEKNVFKGALLDVTCDEPLKKDSKLYNFSPAKLLLTNHTLGYTVCTVPTGFEFFYNNLEHYIQTGKPLTIIDKNKQY